MDAIWQNAVRKTRECTQQTTTKPPKATTTTTNHETPRPSDKIQKIWGKIVKQTAKTAWQCSYGYPGQHFLVEGWEAQRTMINRATKDAITTNRSVSEHDEKRCLNGAARDQGYSWTTSAPRLLLSDHVLRLVTQNEQVEHKQPQGMNSQILRDS